MSNSYDPHNQAGVPGPFQRPGAYSAAPTENPEPAKKNKKKGDKPTVTRRVVGRHTKLAVIFATVAALAVVLLVAAPGGATKYVARTTVAISALSQVGSSQFEIIEVDADLVEDGAIAADSEADAVEQLRTVAKDGKLIVNLAARQQVHTDYFATETTLGTPLNPTERLMSIQASVATAVAGRVRAGDHVDIFAVVANGANTFAGIVLANVEVVAVSAAEGTVNAAAQAQASAENKDRAPGELLPSKPVPGMYVIRVNIADVPRLMAVNTGAEIYLALRGSDASSVPVATADVIATVCGKNNPSATAGGGATVCR